MIGALALWAGLATDNGGLLFGGGSCWRHRGVPLPRRLAACKIDQTEALAVASRTVGFPVGHASAQLAGAGCARRPAWRILVYSADEPPSIRGLVELDAVDGHVLGEYTEHNPEDWSQSPVEFRTVAESRRRDASCGISHDFKKFILRGNVSISRRVVVGAAFNTCHRSHDIVSVRRASSASRIRRVSSTSATDGRGRVFITRSSTSIIAFACSSR